MAEERVPLEIRRAEPEDAAELLSISAHMWRRAG